MTTLAQKAGAVIKYRRSLHRRLPHIVRFSGGRSSAMMALELAGSGQLSAERGDLALFSNTTAEHPATYNFVARVKSELENKHGIPLLMVEFITIEDARGGEWRRLPSFRLTNERPRSEDNPDGYRSRGEAFRELLSLTAYIPNQFSRSCTSGLKIKPTRQLLAQLLSGHPTLPAAGVVSDHSLVDPDIAYRRYRTNGGTSPRRIFEAKRAYALSMPCHRPTQRISDFSDIFRPHENDEVSAHVYGGRADIDRQSLYISLIGLRSDETPRVNAVKRRAAHDPAGKAAEIIYTPLADAGTESEDVAEYYKSADFDLELDPADNLGNCVFCFLKGPASLRELRDVTRARNEASGTPATIEWWTETEKTYRRDLVAEAGGPRDPEAPGEIGFFGATGLSFADIQNADDQTRLPAWAERPCICTN